MHKSCININIGNDGTKIIGIIDIGETVSVRAFHPIAEESFDDDMCEITTGCLANERRALPTLPGKYVLSRHWTLPRLVLIPSRNASPRWSTIRLARCNRKNALFHSIFVWFSYSFSRLRRHNLHSQVTNGSRNRVARSLNADRNVKLERSLKYFGVLDSKRVFFKRLFSSTLLHKLHNTWLCEQFLSLWTMCTCPCKTKSRNIIVYF